jgi:hypothetical protein
MLFIVEMSMYFIVLAYTIMAQLVKYELEVVIWFHKHRDIILNWNSLVHANNLKTSTFSAWKIRAVNCHNVSQPQTFNTN